MPLHGSRSVQGVSVPPFLYGTAWKEERTEGLTRLAIAAGFRGMDTANQRRHYFEAAVGAGVAAASGEIDRGSIFLQTKFTHRAGQDHRLPYDPGADIGVQVRQSFESSLEHLRSPHVESYVLHGPSTRRGLTEEDWRAWRAMEELQREGKARLLGVSNVSLEQLSTLHGGAAVKPVFVQNRCYASTGWDREVRAFCRENGLFYQGFSLLTANARELAGSAFARVANRAGRSPAQVAFAFALAVGMIPLTGTSSAEHMTEDLAALDLALEPAEVDALERVSG